MAFSLQKLFEEHSIQFDSRTSKLQVFNLLGFNVSWKIPQRNSSINSWILSWSITKLAIQKCPSGKTYFDKQLNMNWVSLGKLLNFKICDPVVKYNLSRKIFPENTIYRAKLVLTSSAQYEMFPFGGDNTFCTCSKDTNSLNNSEHKTKTNIQTVNKKTTNKQKLKKNQIKSNLGCCTKQKQIYRLST